ncbi:MAG TPA: serine hydrolase domain-containing protein [Bryobacteraceae bacterium]|nr:serine hydrolase domain-containing protein [Bryobacteraceae bacterium]
MRKPLWLISIALVAASAVAQDPAAIIARIEAPQTPNHQGLDGYTLAEIMHQFHVPGVSIAVVRDFKIDWAKAYGVADVETNQPAEPTTLFQAASISKPITAMAALKLIEQGRFSLDDDINTILKSWHVSNNGYPAVTPRSLMSHTSGADDGFGFPGYDPSAPRPTLVQLLNGEKPSITGPVLFARPPYQAYKYSGGGVEIMQLALGDVTHQPFAEMMRSLVLDPLEMRDSSYEQPPTGDRAARTARAHNGQGKSMGAKWHVYPEQAAARLWTTPSDLARFIIEVQRAVRGPQGSVLSQQSAMAMVAPVGVGLFAVGLEIEKRGEGWYFTHSGGNWGFNCDLLGHVRKGYGVAVMTNTDNAGAVIHEIEARVAAAYNWDSLDKPLLR